MPVNKHNIIDTHSHLDDKKFDKDRDEVIARAKEAGVGTIINVGCWSVEKGFTPTIDLLKKNDNIYAILGAHPHDAKDINEGMYQEIKELASKERVVAIGETGLDYHYDYSPREIQKEVFRKHIQLAGTLCLPLVIHAREAQEDTLEIMKDEKADAIGGVFHCFTGSYEMARECLDMGFSLSFTGVITFPKATDLQDVVRKVPIERMMVETDCPFLSPVPHRGKRNEPAFVIETAKMLARLKKLSLEDVARITTSNAERLFGIGGGAENPRIAYRIRDSLYLNITNRCTNNCTFCAKYKSFTVKGHYLRLKYEPTFIDVMREIGTDPTAYKEIVFCGYGEPLIRLDLVKEVGLHLKKMGCRIRVDTDGLANLVHKRNVLPELMFLDEISVSLNAPDSKTYQEIVRTPFGDKSFPAICFFLKEAKKHIAKVTASVVGVPGLDIEACRRLAEDEIGVVFRVREYNEVG